MESCGAEARSALLPAVSHRLTCERLVHEARITRSVAGRDSRGSNSHVHRHQRQSTQCGEAPVDAAAMSDDGLHFVPSPYIGVRSRTSHTRRSRWIGAKGCSNNMTGLVFRQGVALGRSASRHLSVPISRNALRSLWLPFLSSRLGERRLAVRRTP